MSRRPDHHEVVDIVILIMALAYMLLLLLEVL
jgi:hypothetical protein